MEAKGAGAGAAAAGAGAEGMTLSFSFDMMGMLWCSYRRYYVMFVVCGERRSRTSSSVS